MNMLLLTLAIAVLSVARTTRLIIWDEYPPAKWLRDKWDAKVTGGWNTLLHCGFCAAPYVAVGMAVWTLAVQPWKAPFDAWSAEWWWWVLNGTWGLSYVASIVVAHDQPED